VIISVLREVLLEDPPFLPVHPLLLLHLAELLFPPAPEVLPGIMKILKNALLAERLSPSFAAFGAVTSYNF
jgi:hypothetical protein